MKTFIKPANGHLIRDNRTKKIEAILTRVN